MGTMKSIYKRTLQLLSHALLFCASVPAPAMDMRVEGDTLYMSGRVDGLDYVRFTKSLTPFIRRVVFTNSPGGAYEETVPSITPLIRERGLTTIVQGYCNSACALMFLGGVDRRLADSRSYVAFHGYYKANLDRPSSAKYGEIARLLSEYTNGKLDGKLIDLMLSRPRNGFVYFFRDRTFLCNGDEPKRPSGCEKLPQTALDMGIITSLGNDVPEAELDKLPITSKQGRAEYKRYVETTLPKAFAISPDKSRFAWRSTAQGTTEATNLTLARCAELAGEPCHLYAVNNDVVWKEQTAEGLQ